MNRVAMNKLGLADEARWHPHLLIDLRSDKDAFSKLLRRQLVEAADRHAKALDGIFTVLLDADITFSFGVIDAALLNAIEQTIYEVEIVAKLSADTAGAVGRSSVAGIIDFGDHIDAFLQLISQIAEQRYLPAASVRIWFNFVVHLLKTIPFTPLRFLIGDGIFPQNFLE